MLTDSEPASAKLHTALITGASAGLGAEFARQLAAKRIDLILVARRTEPMQALAQELQRDHGVRVTTISADLSDLEAPKRIRREVRKLGRHVTYLVNNAGAGGPELVEHRDWNAHHDYLQLMLVSVAALCHEFIPHMRANGFGRIVNVASVAGRLARGGDNHYGPAKAYVIALSESLALSYRHEGVHSTALCPGFTHTDFHQAPDLAAMKASTPKFIWYNADVVVREGLRAVEKGKPVYVSGRLYRWIDPLLQSVWTRALFRINRR